MILIIGIDSMSSTCSTILSAFANRPGYVRNDDLRIGLGIKTVEEETECLAKKYKSRLESNADSLARNLYILNLARRLGKASGGSDHGTISQCC